MKITKALIGRYAEVVWMDPIGVQRCPADKAPRGLAGLAKWAERGVIDDITDDVLRVIHSAGCEPGSDTADEISYSLIHGALVVSVTLYEPVKEPV